MHGPFPVSPRHIDLPNLSAPPPGPQTLPHIPVQGSHSCSIFVDQVFKEARDLELRITISRCGNALDLLSNMISKTRLLPQGYGLTLCCGHDEIGAILDLRLVKRVLPNLDALTLKLKLSNSDTSDKMEMLKSSTSSIGFMSSSIVCDWLLILLSYSATPLV